MTRTYIWFCGPSGVGKTWLSDRCRGDLALCNELGLGIESTAKIHYVGKIESEADLESLAGVDADIVFIHWQAGYDGYGYGVQRLRKADQSGRHVVVEIHRDDCERLTALREKPYMQDKPDDEIQAAFSDWARIDYGEIEKHAGTVDFIRVFLRGDRVRRSETM